MWQSHPLYSLVRDAPKESFLSTFQWLISHASNDELCSISSSIWASWFCRNKEVMTNTTSDVRQMASSFAKLISDYQQYSQMLGVTNPPCVLSYQKWEPPREGTVKINFDAHVGVALHRGLGVVVRNHNGNVLLTGTRRVEANWNVHITEAATAMYALEIARRLGYEHVHLEGDSMLVNNAITRKEQGSTHINLFFDQILEYSVCFTSFTCSFVRRQGNIVAHMIAKWDTGSAQEKICMEPFPPSLLTLVALDN